MEITSAVKTRSKTIVTIPDAEPKRHQPELCVLSFGGGQDSTAILYLLTYVPEFRARYAPGKLIAVMSDTMNEFPETYRHTANIQRFCTEHGIQFFFLKPDMGFHGWDGLTEQYRKNTTIGSKGFTSKACTDCLKISPIYSFLEHHVGQTYNLPIGRKQALIQFSKRYGKVRMLVGIARGEEKRLKRAQEEKEKWKAQSIEMAYPLVDIGFDRGDCQRFIKSVGHEVPLPSNCMMCHYCSPLELLWLYRTYPETYREWCELEAAKMERFRLKKPAEKNHGVWRNKTLPQVLEEAIAEFGHMSEEELFQNRMSHGHCVASQY